MLPLGFGAVVPKFWACVLILNGLCFLLCSIFPDLAESKFDSDSSSFICGKTICFLIWTLSSHTAAYRGDAGRWLCPVFGIWTLVTICLIDSRVCPSMPEYARVCARVRFTARADCLCLRSGYLLFFRVSCRGGFLLHKLTYLDSCLHGLLWWWRVLHGYFLPITLPP